jgi:hypothetical protein
MDVGWSETLNLAQADALGWQLAQSFVSSYVGAVHGRARPASYSPCCSLAEKTKYDESTPAGGRR